MFDWLKRKITFFMLARAGIDRQDIKALHTTLTKINNQISWLLEEDKTK